MLYFMRDSLMNLAPGMGDNVAMIISKTIMVLIMIAVIYLSQRIVNKLLDKIIGRLVAKTKTNWDDMLVKEDLFKKLSLFAPAIVVHIMAPMIFPDSQYTIKLLHSAISIYVAIISLRLFYTMLNWVVDVYHSVDREEKMPIRSFVQALKIITFLIVVIIVLSILLNKNPLGLLSGLGALTAILMLVFKDSILGFVAGIQMNANRMVRISDWVEMPKYGADGDVIEVTLTTVKVQNWDKTITTIPAYAMISDSFKNWRGMSESGGRRIKRSIYIDMTSVSFCDDAMLDKFRRVQYISDYIDKKYKEVTEYNRDKKIDPSVTVNGRRLTNLGTFRAYLQAYLRNHAMVNMDMTFLVRQLQPTSQGVPVEVYVFCKDKIWANYEAIQADIFDHILAVVPEFGLRVFQNPTGHDMQQITMPVSES